MNSYVVPFIKSHRYMLIMLSIFLAGTLLFAILLLINQRIPGSDDTVFQTQILPYHSVIDWVIYRYSSWSGRLFSEGLIYIFSPAPFYFWQITTLFIYTIFSGILFFYYKLISPKQSPKDYPTLIVILALPFLADRSVLADGAIWATGSIVYFWMSVLGLVAFYPIAYYVAKRKRPHWLITAIGIISAFIAASSQEQVGAVLLGMTVAFFIHTELTTAKPRHLHIPWYIIIFGVVIGSSLLISVLAPGNGLRLNAENITWLPDFYEVLIQQRIDYSYRWFIDAFINHSGFLLITTWTSMVLLFMKKNNKKIIDYLFVSLLIVACVLLLSRDSDMTSYWLNFYATWKADTPSVLNSLNLIPWTIVLIGTVITPVVLFRKQSIGYLISILFIAAIASTLILLLSPTMYASLWRSFFVPSVILMIIAYILFIRLLGAYWKQKYLLIIVVLSIAFSHYTLQVARLVHNFYT